MKLYNDIVRPLAFNFDAEKVHETAMRAIERGLFQAPAFEHRALGQELFGVQFPNPLGLAAGFDKNAVALNFWHRLGFGFVECGTATLQAQPGNPRPRLFRLPKDQALVNRLGFNNDGSAAMAQRIRGSNPAIPIGVNIGKSKITPIEEAARDYRGSYELLHDLGSYFAINVSSPNTPGLRTLQDPQRLGEILAALKEVDPVRPLFVKVAPDLEFEALDEIVKVVHDAKLTGLIATNTTTSRTGLSADPGQEGGLSGRPLKKRSNEVLANLFRSCDPSMILMGVGGIFNGQDLYEKIRFGAHLCQVYTGWVYNGPRMVPESLAELVQLLERDGFKSVAEARGTADL